MGRFLALIDSDCRANAGAGHRDRMQSAESDRRRVGLVRTADR